MSFALFALMPYVCARVNSLTFLIVLVHAHALDSLTHEAQKIITRGAKLFVSAACVVASLHERGKRETGVLPSDGRVNNE